MSSIRKRKAIITVFSILIACTLAVLIQASAKVFAGDVTEKTDVKITEFSISHEDVSNTNPEFMVRKIQSKNELGRICLRQ